MKLDELKIGDVVYYKYYNDGATLYRFFIIHKIRIKESLRHPFGFSVLKELRKNIEFIDDEMTYGYVSPTDESDTKFRYTSFVTKSGHLTLMKSKKTTDQVDDTRKLHFYEGNPKRFYLKPKDSNFYSVTEKMLHNRGVN